MFKMYQYFDSHHLWNTPYKSRSSSPCWMIYLPDKSDISSITANPHEGKKFLLTTQLVNYERQNHTKQTCYISCYVIITVNILFKCVHLLNKSFQISSPVLLDTAIFPFSSDITTQVEQPSLLPAQLDRTKMLERPHVKYY